MNNQCFIYDNDCGMCASFVRYCEKRIKTQNLLFIPSHSWQDRTTIDLSKTALFVDGDKEWTEHEAISKVLDHLALPWRFIGAIITSPLISWVARRIYRFVSKNRKSGACVLFSKNYTKR